MHLTTRSFRLIVLLMVVAGLLLAIGSAGHVAAQGGAIAAQAVPVVYPAIFAGDVRALPPEKPYAKWDHATQPGPAPSKIAIEPSDGGPREPNPVASPSSAM